MVGLATRMFALGRYAIAFLLPAILIPFSNPTQGNSIIGPAPSAVEAPTASKAWTATVDAEVLKSLPESEINRQT